MKQGALLLVLFWCAASLGTLVLGRDASLPLRATLGLGLGAQFGLLLGVCGQLTSPVLLALTVALLFCSYRVGLPRIHWWAALLVLPALMLASFPPFAFDETMYHLPFVSSFASSGAVKFLPEMRFPAFAVLHEMLCVPLLLAGGDTATHVVSLLQAILTAWLLREWRGNVAAALFVGSPIVWYVSAINYVDAGLTLFVTAGFYCLDQSDRRSAGLAGFFLGTAYGFNYLGAFFVLAGLLMVVVRRGRVLEFGLGAVAGGLPTAGWLVWATGNPVFPYATGIFGANPWAPESFGPAEDWLGKIGRFARLAWDVSFCRERVNQQPAITPFLIPCLALLVQKKRVAVLAMVLVYTVIYLYLPRDSRYLLPLVPLVAAAVAPPKPALWLTLLLLSPGPAYAAFHLLIRDGLPPAGPAQQRAWLEVQVPEYRALSMAGSGRVYAAGGEQLKAYAQGELWGDHFGPLAYSRVLGEPRTQDTRVLAERLRDFDYLLVCTRVVPALKPAGGLDLVYADDAAQLWRVP